MNRLVFTALILTLAWAIPGSAAAQEGLAVRIETSQEGLHRITGDRIKAIYSLDQINPERLSLSHDGQPVPIEVFGASDGHFDPSDEILFFAERPRKRYSSTETYVLTDRGQALRFRAAAPPAESGEP